MRRRKGGRDLFWEKIIPYVFRRRGTGTTQIIRGRPGFETRKTKKGKTLQQRRTNYHFFRGPGANKTGEQGKEWKIQKKRQKSPGKKITQMGGEIQEEQGEYSMIRRGEIFVQGQGKWGKST